MPTDCKAYRDPAGDYVCDRCGMRWDADDDKPPCKTLVWLKREETERENREFDRTHEYGRQCLKKIKEGLP